MSAQALKPKCPGCKKSDVLKLEGHCAVCRQCSKSKGCIYRFCWACQREWPSGHPPGDSCPQPNCALRAALLSVKLISDSKSTVKGCPYFRACPGCKALLTHDGSGCPNIECSNCGTDFCFRCLRQECYGRRVRFRCFYLDESRYEFDEPSLIEPCRIADNRKNLEALGL